MLNQKSKCKEYKRGTNVDKDIEEIWVEVNKILNRFGQIEVKEPWLENMPHERKTKKSRGLSQANRFG